MSEYSLNNGERQWRDRGGRLYSGPKMIGIQGISSDVARIGRRLSGEYLVNGNFGNISLKDPDKDGFYITSSGSYLDDPGLLVFVPLKGDVPRNASSEWRVHHEVYTKTRHVAIVHAHPPHAVAHSFFCDEIIPQDCEGIALCPTIPVVTGEPGSQEVAENVADCLCLTNLCIARAHGTFAAGKTLDEAFLYTSIAEYSCQVLLVVRELQREMGTP